MNKQKKNKQTNELAKKTMNTGKIIGKIILQRLLLLVTLISSYSKNFIKLPVADTILQHIRWMQA